MREAISNMDDVIDSRDVIERIEELEAERDACDGQEYEEWQESEAATELAALCNLRDEASPYTQNWRSGATLIRYSYFKEYAMELADDMGAMPKDNAWPSSFIDWDRAARELQQDYTSVDFDGVTYWVR